MPSRRVRFAVLTAATSPCSRKGSPKVWELTSATHSMRTFGRSSKERWSARRHLSISQPTPSPPSWDRTLSRPPRSSCVQCPDRDPLRACREEPRGASGRIGGCPRNRGQGSQGYCVRLVCVPANEGVLTSATSTTTASTGEQRELRVCAGMRRSKGRVQIPPSPPRKVLIRSNFLPLLPRNLPFLPRSRCGWR